MFDTNGDSHISVEELRQMMSNFGDTPDPADLKKMMDSVDTDSKNISDFSI